MDKDNSEEEEDKKESAEDDAEGEADAAEGPAPISYEECVFFRYVACAAPKAATRTGLSGKARAPRWERSRSWTMSPSAVDRRRERDDVRGGEPELPREPGDPEDAKSPTRAACFLGGVPRPGDDRRRAHHPGNRRGRGNVVPGYAQNLDGFELGAADRARG